jgi:hypothetical protein
MACGSAWSAAGAQENNGNHYGWGNRDRNQCGAQYRRHHRHHRDNDNDNDNDRDESNRNGQYGDYGQYGQNRNDGRYNQCGTQYGNNGQGNRNGNSVVTGTIVAVNSNMVTIRTNGGYANNGGYGGYGNNNGYGQTVTINDQPALDNQTSGRVSVGRYVTAYGYWQNGTFYATRMN